MKIIFVHGLESGISGKKAKYLIEQFQHKNVIIPDMEVSMFNITKKNSFLRLAILSFSWYMFILSFFTIFSFQLINLNFEMKISLLIVISICILQFVKKTIQKCFENCSDIVQNTILYNGLQNEEFKLIGSSWGAAICLDLLSKNLVQPKKSLLLAPACATKGVIDLVWPDFFPQNLPNDGQNITIIHGLNDKVVPISVSHMLKNQFNKIELIQIKDGDHTLNEQLINSGILKKIIDNL